MISAMTTPKAFAPRRLEVSVGLLPGAEQLGRRVQSPVQQGEGDKGLHKPTEKL